MHNNKYICSYPNCAGLSFKNQRGVLFHERRNPRHNPSMIINRFSNGGGNKRHQIPYEYSTSVGQKTLQSLQNGYRAYRMVTELTESLQRKLKSLQTLQKAYREKLTKKPCKLPVRLIISL